MPQAAAFGWGASIAVLGGLIGLGGAEFRLPVQAGVFKYRTLQAIVINLAVSLVTVIFSFIFRTGLVNLDSDHYSCRSDSQYFSRFVIGCVCRRQFRAAD